MTIAGVGLDVVEIARFERLLARTPEFAERYFTPREREACARHVHAARRWASTFAVKEALLKALGRGVLDGIALGDVEVCFDGGAVRIETAGSAARELGARRLLVSVSHDARHAWALVVVALSVER